MPELPEVETVRRGLEPALVGRRILGVEQRRPDLRFPLPERFADRLAGRTILTLGRRAKYLVASLDSGESLVMHLGMSGSFRVDGPPGAHWAGNGVAVAGDAFAYARSKIAAHDHVVFHLEGGARVTYNDPRRFGYMLLVEPDGLAAHAMFCGLGMEPVGTDLSAERLAAALAGKATSLKAALLDQRIIAGLGNIYVCEALWRARLSPRRLAGTLVKKDATPSVRLAALVEAIRGTIEDAIAAGGSSLRDYVHADGSLGYFQHAFAVYGREHEPCARPTCQGVVRRIVQTGRSTFYCPHCQR